MHVLSAIIHIVAASVVLSLRLKFLQEKKMVGSPDSGGATPAARVMNSAQTLIASYVLRQESPSRQQIRKQKSSRHQPT